MMLSGAYTDVNINPFCPKLNCRAVEQMECVLARNSGVFFFYNGHYGLRWKAHDMVWYGSYMEWFGSFFTMDCGKRTWLPHSGKSFFSGILQHSHPLHGNHVVWCDGWIHHEKQPATTVVDICWKSSSTKSVFYHMLFSVYTSGWLDMYVYIYKISLISLIYLSYPNPNPNPILSNPIQSYLSFWSDLICSDPIQSTELWGPSAAPGSFGGALSETWGSPGPGLPR